MPGFHRDTREGVNLSGWEQSSFVLDAIAPGATALGFSNRSQQEVFNIARQTARPDELETCTPSAPYWLGAPIEAFRGPDQSDPFLSHDPGVIDTVIEGWID